MVGSLLCRWALDERIVGRFKRGAMLLPVMKNKPVLELADVKAIAQAAEAEALKNSWAVSIAIVDDGGHLLLLHRLDGAAPISAQIAPAKAQTAALGRRETKSYEDTINNGRTAFLS